MLGAFFSPLAPAAILLLSAFILPVGLPWLQRTYPKLYPYSPASLVGVAILSLLGVRLTPGSNAGGEGLELISGWNFSTIESVAALMVRADFLSLPFLIVTLLLLLAVALLFDQAVDKIQWGSLSTWLALGAIACLIFVSGNGLTLVYATIIFDAAVALMWLRVGQHNLSLAHLFLGALTAAGVTLETLLPVESVAARTLLLSLALWARLGLYSFIEATAHLHWPGNQRLLYVGLSLVVAFYLTLRLLDAPLPAALYWPLLVMMFLGGFYTWLVGMSDVIEVDGKPSQLLVGLILTESLLVLLAAPLTSGSGIAFSVGLVLSLVALWVTPALGKPRLSEVAWSWPYLPAVFATLNLVGLSLWLGWSVRIVIYEFIFRIGIIATIIVLLAEMLAFSGLARYWLILFKGQDTSGRRSAVGIVAIVPFLTPALGPFILSAITQTDLAAGSVAWGGVWLMLAVLVAGAIALDYFRPAIASRLNIPVEMFLDVLRLRWLLRGCESLLNQISKGLLRVRVTLEGRHYLAWAMFAALVGALIILLREL
jgi:hypothetical protein